MHLTTLPALVAHLEVLRLSRGYDMAQLSGLAGYSANHYGNGLKRQSFSFEAQGRYLAVFGLRLTITQVERKRENDRTESIE